MEPESETELVKLVYDNGGEHRALKGRIRGETPDGLFFVVVRPNGQVIRIAKSAVKAISPISEIGER